MALGETDHPAQWAGICFAEQQGLNPPAQTGQGGGEDEMSRIRCFSRPGAGRSSLTHSLMKEPPAELALPLRNRPGCRACRLRGTRRAYAQPEQLAQAVGKSVSQLHRLFKGAAGADAAAICLGATRGAAARAQLPTARTVTEAMHEGWFASSGRLCPPTPCWA